MSKLFLKTILGVPFALVASLLVAGGANANPSDSVTPQTKLEVSKTSVKIPQQVAQVPPAQGNNVLDQINRYNKEGNNSLTIDQVTNVSELKDVSPGDWAYSALQSLVERYGCIAGYPDGNFKGNRAMTRYEFAAALNACLQQIEKLIAAQTSEFVTKEDLKNLDTLKNDFAPELEKISGRVDGLEGRISKLEKSQFSTTTKLVGEAIFALTDNFGKNYNQNAVLGDRVRLDFQSSFTGSDKLHTRLAAGNLSSFLSQYGRTTANPAGTGAEGTQTFDLTGSTNTSNGFALDWLAYEFPWGKNAKVYVAATGGLFADIAPTLNPYFDDGDGGKGALSVFAQNNPIYRLGGGAGAGVTYNFGSGGSFSPASLTLAYLADNANSPAQGAGLFNGDYAALAQLTFNLSDSFQVAGTYVNSYHTTPSDLFDAGGGRGITGTALANNPTAGPIQGNSYGVQAAWKVSDKLSISAFGGSTFARGMTSNQDANIWYYGGGLAFPDLGKKGNLGGIFVGVEPYTNGLRTIGGSNTLRADTPLHIEGFYKYQLTDNVSITPGIIWISTPNQDTTNQDAVIGTLRTTFSF